MSEVRLSHPLGDTVAQSVRDYEMPVCGSSVLALCSGGIDSVCMVDLLARLPRGVRPRQISVLFCDHGLRDVAAEREASQGVARRHGLAWFERRADALSGNMQRAARSWRYTTAAQLAASLECDVVATGHTADDQLESLLLGMTSSSGPRAMQGIAAVREMASIIPADTSDRVVIRPIIALRRHDLVTYARTRELTTADDPSNSDRRFTRNRIRHDVVPQLLTSDPRSAHNLERSRAQIAESAEALEALSRELLQNWDDGSGSINAAALRHLPSSARRAVLATWLRDHGVGRGVNSRTIEQLDRVVSTGHVGDVHARGLTLSLRAGRLSARVRAGG